MRHSVLPPPRTVAVDAVSAEIIAQAFWLLAVPDEESLTTPSHLSYLYRAIYLIATGKCIEMANRGEREHRSIIARHYAYRGRDSFLRLLLTRDRAVPRAKFRMLASTALLTVGLLLSAASHSAQ